MRRRGTDGAPVQTRQNQTQHLFSAPLDNHYKSEYSVAVLKSDRKEILTRVPPASLRAWREANGLDQRQAAEYLDISQPYYSKLEMGRAAPRPVIAKRVTERTGVRLEVLLRIAS